MRHPFRSGFASLVVAGIVVSLLAVVTAGQGKESKPNATAASGKTWKAPRTPWGHPDLQGTYANNGATPFERPKQLAGRPLLTDAELASLKQKAAELFNGETDAAFGDEVYLTAIGGASGFRSTDTTGNYNHFWLVDREFDNRTSLIVDPQDGRLPALTPAAQRHEAERAAYRKAHPYDGPEDIPLSQRCVTRGIPAIRAGYNSYYQILQTPGHVAIHMEMMHDTRIIPLDGRAHLTSAVGQMLGDSRGRWEGDTLVVETTNFTEKPDGTSQLRFWQSRKMKLIERFTRVAPNRVQYEFTIDDPDVWTRPWTAMIPWEQTTDLIYEFACHEGNASAMIGTLRGARLQEQAAAAKPAGRSK